jgi:L-aminopeptidase/D-esterase-like protein
MNAPIRPGCEQITAAIHSIAEYVEQNGIGGGQTAYTSEPLGGQGTATLTADAEGAFYAAFFGVRSANNTVVTVKGIPNGGRALIQLEAQNTTSLTFASGETVPLTIKFASRGLSPTQRIGAVDLFSIARIEDILYISTINDFV